MQTDETIINLLTKLLQQQSTNSSFEDGKITYNGNSFQLPKTSSTTGGKRTTNLKYR